MPEVSFEKQKFQHRMEDAAKDAKAREGAVQEKQRAPSRGRDLELSKNDVPLELEPRKKAA